MKLALVCDDDAHIRDLVSAILTSEGYKVIQAENGRKICEIISTDDRVRKHAQVLVLDIRMPQMTGLEVLDKLNETGVLDHLPVIMLTAEDTSDDIMLGYEKGASYYVTKPFSKQQLLYGLKLVMDEDSDG
jgi:two-component system sensor histidine kinase ChiS